VGSFGAAVEEDIIGQGPINFHIDDKMATSDDDLAQGSSDTDNVGVQTIESGQSESYCSILGFSTRSDATSVKVPWIQWL
jgi:hypothetical protein